jgi:hypothetical protein
MRKTIVITLALIVSGCGAEVIGSAATGAASKAEELKQAQKTKDQVVQRLDAANQAAQQNLQEADKAANQ